MVRAWFQMQELKKESREAGQQRRNTVGLISMHFRRRLSYQERCSRPWHWIL